jgi:hypothetical protein
MNTRFIGLLAAVCALAGCTELVGPGHDARLDFTVNSLTVGEYLPLPEISATGGTGEITVLTKMSAPDPCRRLSAQLGADGRTLRLEVVVDPISQVCVAAVGTFTYTARVYAVNPGRYTVEIRHTYVGSGWPGGWVHASTVVVD